VGLRKAAPQVVLDVKLMYRVQLYVGVVEGADGTLDPPLSAWQTGRPQRDIELHRCCSFARDSLPSTCQNRKGHLS
jgi:hypothetical protein